MRLWQPYNPRINEVAAPVSYQPGGAVITVVCPECGTARQANVSEPADCDENTTEVVCVNPHCHIDGNGYYEKCIIEIATLRNGSVKVRRRSDSFHFGGRDYEPTRI